MKEKKINDRKLETCNGAGKRRGDKISEKVMENKNTNKKNKCFTSASENFYYVWIMCPVNIFVPSAATKHKMTKLFFTLTAKIYDRI